MNVDKEYVDWLKKKDPYWYSKGLLGMAFYYKKKAEKELDKIKKEKYEKKSEILFKESKKYEEKASKIFRRF